MQDESKEMRDLIEAHERELKDRLNKSNQRTGMERRSGRERRRKQLPYEGPDKRRDIGRRGKYDRRTDDENYGYKDPDITKE